MKAQFLKIAKVKDEKAFYKKYPTEAAFFKAHPEAKQQVKKAQMGVDVNKNGIPDYLENINPIQGPQNIINLPRAPIAQEEIYNPALQSGLSTYTPSVQDTILQGQAITGAAPQQDAPLNLPSFSDKAMPFVGAAQSIISGIGGLKAQKQEERKVRQARKVTDVQKIASGIREKDPERRYNTPWDNPVQPGQMFPTYGVGTNVLAKNGAMLYSGGEIQNTYAPNYLYDDLGYEPLNDSNKVKQYYYGGGIPRAQDGGGFMDFMGSQGGGQSLQMLTGALSNNNAESQIGSGIGTAAGTAIGGPVGGMIGGALGNVVGGMFNTSQKSIKRDQNAIQKNIDTIMGNQFGQSFQNQYSSVVRDGGDIPNYEEGGWVSNDWTPQVIASFGDLTSEDYHRFAHKDEFRAGGHLKSYTPPSARAMETYEDGGEVRRSALNGEVQTTWGGGIKTLSHNPYMPGTGETIQFVGNSHDTYDPKSKQTGIGVKYGQGDQDSYTDYAEYGTEQADANVEVEKEPAAELIDPVTGEKNLTVWGNLKIPNQYLEMLGDPKAKGKKFKNYIAEISKDESKQNKLIEKSTNLLNSVDVRNSFDKLKFDALTANIDGANMKLKSIADKKMNAAFLQNAINDTAEEYGLVADDLAKGKGKVNKEAMKEYAEYGKSIQKAQSGIYKTKGTGDKWSFTQAGETGNPLFDDMQRYENEWAPEVNKALSDKERADKMLTYIENYSGEGSTNIKKALNKIPTKEGKIMFLQQQATNKEVGPIHYVVDAAIKFTSPQMTTPLKETIKETKKEEDKTYQTTPYKRSTVMDIANQILPFIRPTDQEPLDPNQLMGELYALSNNQLEPVQAQTYQPNLLNTYDISLQDQLNANQADFNSMQRMAGYNPQAQSILAAQKYAANTGVLGEQFRQNQAMDMGIYNANTQTLNDAQVKNLAIYDQQYGRQEQAKSNTKAITQAALNSIGDKYAKNRLENRELGIMENMYNYRFDPAGRAINMNPLYQANMPTVYSKQSNPNMLPVYDADGNQTGWRPASATPGIVADKEPTPAKFGKAVLKYAKNGSIVKSYKNL